MSEIECAYYFIGKFYMTNVIRSKEEAKICSILAIEELQKDTQRFEYWENVKDIIRTL
jgi:hypothetical protein